VDDTVAIDYFHCGQHYSALGGIPLPCFWSRIVAGDVASSTKSYEFGLTAGSNVVGSSC